MTNEDAIRWLDNLKNDIGNPHYERLWPYAQAIDEICFMLKEQESVIEALKSDLDETLVVLSEQPEIVRCKECKHRGNSEKCVLSAISEEKDFPLFMLDNRGDWFCADGKRR